MTREFYLVKLLKDEASEKDRKNKTSKIIFTIWLQVNFDATSAFIAFFVSLIQYYHEEKKVNIKTYFNLQYIILYLHNIYIVFKKYLQKIYINYTISKIIYYLSCITNA